MLGKKTDEELLEAAQSLEKVMLEKLAANEDPSSVANAFGVYMKELERRQSAATNFQTPQKQVPSSVGSFVRHTSAIASSRSDRSCSISIAQDNDPLLVKGEPTSTSAISIPSCKRPFLSRSSRKHCRMYVT
jgi:hypothetical protein